MLSNFFETIINHPHWQVFLTLLLIGYTLATLFQIAFYYGFLGRFSRYKPQEIAENAQNKAGFSIIICARNEAENLQTNLKNILAQQYPTFEVLVIDDDSTDKSFEILSTLQQQYPQLRVEYLKQKQRLGKKDALSYGISKAKYDNLLMTDADCKTVSPFWLQKMADQLQNNANIVLGFGPYIQTKGALNFWVRFEAIHTALLYFSFSLQGLPYMGVGRNIAWKKNLFDIIGGFKSHAHLPSGDDDLFVSAASTANNTELCIDPETFMYSETKNTWWDYYKQKKRHLSTGWHYRWQHQILLAMLSLSHTLHYFAFILLLGFKFGTVFVFSLYIIRTLTIIVVYVPTLHKLRANNLIPFLPILDAALAGYYVVFAPILFLHSFKNKGHSWN